jgi:hypothetical protein
MRHNERGGRYNDIMMKARNLRPLLIALPVLLALATGAVLMLQPDPAPPPSPPPIENAPPELPDNTPEQPLEPERPISPSPPHGGPTSAAVADAMRAEARAALEAIRARLELKYKYADYSLDRSLTVESLMRKLERLDGEHFRGTDFHLTFGEEVTAVIECRTAAGNELPDGVLSMRVDLRTGLSDLSGTIFARTHDGRLLPGAEDYRALSEFFSSCVLRHYSTQAGLENGIAPVNLPRRPDWLTEEDVRVTTDPEHRRYSLRIETLKGTALAEPLQVAVDYAAGTIEATEAASEEWLRGPEDREDFKSSIRWALYWTAMRASQLVMQGAEPASIRASSLGTSYWYFRRYGFTPFDVRVTIDATDAQAPAVTLEIATSYGRPLSFNPVRFVLRHGDKEGEFVD